MSVCALRQGDMTPVLSCFTAFKHYELTYNQYIWDRDTERGETLDWPRPTAQSNG